MGIPGALLSRAARALTGREGRNAAPRLFAAQHIPFKPPAAFPLPVVSLGSLSEFLHEIPKFLNYFLNIDVRNMPIYKRIWFK